MHKPHGVFLKWHFTILLSLNGFTCFILVKEVAFADEVASKRCKLMINDVINYKISTKELPLFGLMENIKNSYMSRTFSFELLSCDKRLMFNLINQDKK